MKTILVAKVPRVKCEEHGVHMEPSEKDVVKLVPKVKRIVVRGKYAVAIFPGQSAFDLVFENGVWKGN